VVLKALSSRIAWVVFVVAAVAVLAVGSYHPPPSSAAVRISQLDSVIKCPGCEDLSIAESQAASSVTLRGEVARWVHEGWSNARVEQAVVDRYGETGLLVPQNAAGSVLYLLPAALVLIAALCLAIFLWRRRSLAAVPVVAGERGEAAP
jgi:cytochrome c-type biogenesis protein CcmH